MSSASVPPSYPMPAGSAPRPQSGPGATPPPKDGEPATVNEASGAEAVEASFWQQPFAQNVLPFLTSLILHAALIFLGIWLASLAVNKVFRAANKEQVVIPDAPIDGSELGTIPHPGLGGDPNRDAAQDKLPNVPPDPNGMFDKKSDVADVVNPGGGAGDAASEIASGPNAGMMGKGGGSGTGVGDGLGGGNGTGGGLAKYGIPGGGGGIGVKFGGIRANAKRVVFVLDATGSMMSKFDDLRAEVHKAIDGLHPPQYFNVVFFQDNMKEPTVGKELFLATPDNKKKVEDFVDRTTPRGPTDPIPAIKLAFAMHPDLCYFLVDPGDFPDNQAVIDTFKSLNVGAKAKVNTIAFLDRDESGEKVLKTIADNGKGVFRPVAEEDLSK